MIDMADILLQVQTQLRADTGLDAILDDVNIEVNVFVNEDSDRAPWIGIYPGVLNYEPRTLGSIDNWEAFPAVRIICQASDIGDATQCTVALQDLVEKVKSAIIADETIGGKVDMITKYSVEYGFIQPDERTSLHFQSAIITFELEVSTQ